MTDENGAYFLNGTPLTTYTAQKNYYFVAGDNIFDSRDSRYWGLLQEEYIVGTCTVHPVFQRPANRQNSLETNI